MNINELMSRSMRRRTTVSRTPVRMSIFPGGRSGFIPSIRSRTLEQVAPSSRLALLQRTATRRRIPGRTFRATRLTSLRDIIPGVSATPGIIPQMTGRAYVIPPPRTAAAPGGGLSTGASNLGTQLGDIGSSLTGFGGEIGGKAKELIPLAVKIVGAVIIVKIVLWVIRGRR